VFFMQAGFGMLEVGSVRKKNQRNILTKNIVDAAIGAFSFWTVGYAFAFGTVGTTFDAATNTTVDDPGAFIGLSDFGLR
jgi:Amt family ammonium transporter